MTRASRVALVCCLLTAARGRAVDAVTAPPARIVNGAATDDFPAVGMLMAGGEFCTAALIGCRTVLTAAHCVCDPSANTFDQCQRDGGPNPTWMLFAPQYAGAVTVHSVAVDPEYDFGKGGDLAVVTLDQAITGITPLPFNTTAQPTSGTSGTIVGFGRTGGNPDLVFDAGIKRRGAIRTAVCPGPNGGDPGIPADTHLCVDVLDHADSGTCQGDSGGPLIVDLGGGETIAGISSGYAGDNLDADCLPDAISFFTDVYRYRAFVADQLGSDSGPCGALPPVGSPRTRVETAAGSLSDLVPHFETTIAVPAGTELLRVNMNGALFTRTRFTNFDLFINVNAAASSAEHVCAGTGGLAFEACEVARPPAGTWHITVDRVEGRGDFQLVSTLFGVAPTTACIGDCNGDGTVRIDELVRAVDAALGAALEECPAIDANRDGAAHIDELVAAVGNALDHCGVE